MRAPRLVHLTTTDVSLALLLGPQLRAFRSAGFDVVGVSAPGPYVEELRDAGIDHIPLRNATRAPAPHRDLAALAELRSLFRRDRPDIVHTHNPKPGVYGRLAARAARVPGIVNTVHGLYAQPHDPWAKRAVVYGLERVAARCSHAELVQNPEDIDVLVRIGVPREKIQLLGNGIDLSRFDPGAGPDGRRAQLRRELGVGDHEVLVGAVGRMVREKGYEELFAAAARLRVEAPDVRLVVIGPADPDKPDAVDQATLDRATADGVRFLGLRRDVEDLYGALDVYVLASHREGFPRSAMEAAAMGLPIVATDIRGCRQVVDHGRTGLLVPVGRADALAEALTMLATDPATRAAMGAAGRAKAVQEFDQQRQIDISLGTYERLLGRPRVKTT